MTQTDYTTRVLNAEKGSFLTQAGDVPISDRAVTDTVYLAATDSPANWREITAKEAEEIRVAQREAAEAAAEETRQRMTQGHESVLNQ